jgi:hypothetical protein
MVQSQPRQIVGETLSRKNPSQKRAGCVAQSVSPASHQKKKNSLYSSKERMTKNKL